MPTAKEALASIRRHIDCIDADLVELIDRRLELAAATVDAKRRAGLALTDGRREAEVVRVAAARARAKGIEPELVREIFWRVVELSRAAVRHGRRSERTKESEDRTPGRLVDPYDVPSPGSEPHRDAPRVSPAAPERPADGGGGTGPREGAG